MEWLNNNTGNDVNFFLIEIHAYRIGDSIPAPKFEVVEKPNDFVKRGKPRRHGDAALGDMGTLLLSWMDNNNSKNNKRQKQRPPVLSKELNLVFRNGAAPKYDTRDWDPEHKK